MSFVAAAVVVGALDVMDGSAAFRACKSDGNGEDDGSNAVKRGTQLLEIFALQILMLSRQKDKKKLRCVRACECVRECIVCLIGSALGF